MIDSESLLPLRLFVNNRYICLGRKSNGFDENEEDGGEWE